MASHGSAGRSNVRRGVRRDERGQTLAEASVVVALLLLLSIGILEFGRAFMVVSVINNAARVGARSVALATPLERDLNGYVLDVAPIVDRVRSEIAAVTDSNVASSLSISVAQPSTNPPMAQVTISGSVPYMFNLVGSNFSVNRTVSFRDNGR